MQFTDLRIPIGTRMHLTVVGLDYKPQQALAQLLGFRMDHSVLATLTKKPPMPLQHDSQVSVRMGLPSAIVRFDALLQHFQEHPFPHLHMSYPKDVVIEQQLRRSPRFPLDLPAVVAPQLQEANTRPLRGQFTDVSLNGARINLEAKLQSTSAPVQVTATVMVAGAQQQLQLRAEIKSPPDARNTPSDGPFSYGLSFIEMTPAQQLLLQALCYELQANNQAGARAA